MTRPSFQKASADKFQLVVPKLPFDNEILKGRDLVINIFDTIIPGVSLETDEQSFLGNDQVMPVGNLDFENLTTSFNVDDSFENWTLLFRWLTYINNNKDVFIQDKDQFTVDSSLVMYDSFENKILTIKLISLFPTNLSEVTLSERAGSEYLECTSTFVYDYYEIEKTI